MADRIKCVGNELSQDRIQSVNSNVKDGLNTFRLFLGVENKLNSFNPDQAKNRFHFDIPLEGQVVEVGLSERASLLEENRKSETG